MNDQPLIFCYDIKYNLLLLFELSIFVYIIIHKNLCTSYDGLSLPSVVLSTVEAPCHVSLTTDPPAELPEPPSLSSSFCLPSAQHASVAESGLRTDNIAR